MLLIVMNYQLSAVATALPGGDQKNGLVDTCCPTEISLQVGWSVYVLKAIDKEVPLQSSSLEIQWG